MPYRILLALAVAMLAQTAFAKKPSGPANFDESRRRLLSEKMPDLSSEYAVAMGEKREEHRALQSDADSHGVERKLEKMVKQIEAMQTEYKEDVKAEVADLTEDAEKLAARQDKLFARFEKADGDAMEKIQKELTEVKNELDFLNLKKTIISSYGAYGIATPGGLPESMIGSAAPNFRLSKPASDPRSMETVSRSPIRIFVFMSTTNGSSAAYAAAMYNTYHSDTVDVIAIAVGDTDESWAEARPSGFNRMTVLLDPEGKMAMKYKVGFVPQTVVVDESRQIRQVCVGDASAARSAIAKTVRTVQEERKK